MIAAPFNLALGGGCEIILHSNYVQAHVESYIGLTEAALGILPAWGGCKELLGRFASNDDIANGPMPPVIKTFELIGGAKVSTSAHEAKKLGYLKNSDGITMNSVIGRAIRLGLSGNINVKKKSKDDYHHQNIANTQKRGKRNKFVLNKEVLDQLGPAKLLTLEQLTEKTCKYMVHEDQSKEGHPDVVGSFFCGRKK